MFLRNWIRSDLSEKRFRIAFVFDLFRPTSITFYCCTFSLPHIRQPGYKGLPPRELIFLREHFFMIINTAHGEYQVPARSRNLFHIGHSKRTELFAGKMWNKLLFRGIIACQAGWIALSRGNIAWFAKCSQLHSFRSLSIEKWKSVGLCDQKKDSKSEYLMNKNRIWFRISKENLEITMTNRGVDENLNISMSANMDGNFHGSHGEKPISKLKSTEKIKIVGKLVWNGTVYSVIHSSSLH